MRIIPDEKYDGIPCSQVAVGCAYEKTFDKKLSHTVTVKLRDSEGYATLDAVNKTIRSLISVKKKVYFKRTERFALKDFLKDNKEKCIVCVFGHYVFVDEEDYYSFFENEDDMVVCVWYINTDLIEKRKTNEFI